MLTPRQRETIQLLAEGKTNKEVAALLNISVKTVETHRANIMLKTGSAFGHGPGALRDPKRNRPHLRMFKKPTYSFSLREITEFTHASISFTLRG